jgi:hypothetical protein
LLRFIASDECGGEMDEGAEACVDFVGAHGDALELLGLPKKFLIG